MSKDEAGTVERVRRRYEAPLAIRGPYTHEEVGVLLHAHDEAREALRLSVSAWEAAGMQGRSAHDAILALQRRAERAEAERDEAVAERDALAAQLAALRSEVSEAFGLPTGIGPAPGEIARLVREHREMVVRCGEAADYMAADDKRIARLEAQLAAVTEVAEWVCTTLLSGDTGCVEDAIRLAADCERALADAKTAVEAHDRRVQADALEEAADEVCDHEQLAEGRTLADERTALQRWLRARAERIRRGAR